MMLLDINEEGKIRGWYDKKLSKDIPEDVIEIDAEKHKEAISIFATHYIDGEFLNKDDIYLFKNQYILSHVSDQELLDMEDDALMLELKILSDNDKSLLLDRRKKLIYQYLKDTDWIEAYYVKHLLSLELIPENSSKWIIINNREKYKKQLNF